MRCLTLLVFLFLVVPVMAQKPGSFPTGRVVDREEQRVSVVALRLRPAGHRPRFAVGAEPVHVAALAVLV